MAKFDVLSENHKNIFEGTPKSKFWDIANQVDKELLEEEFDKMITKLTIMEKILNDTDLYKNISKFESENSMELEDCKKSLYISLTTNIISKLEQ